MPRAQDDLRAIAAYGAEHHGEDSAACYLRAIDAAFDRLCAFPQMGSVFAPRPVVRSYPVGRHRIFYTINGDRLSVLRVLHMAMDVERHL